MANPLTIQDIIETKGLVTGTKARIVIKQGEQLQGIPASNVGLTGSSNTWAGTNTFSGIVDFDGATDFDGANTFDGSVTFNSVPSLAGGAILFPATQVPSANANALDDYEENTFTPTMIGATTPGVGTYSVQDGRYTKVGRLVFVEIGLTWSAHTGTGSIQLAGLPFTVAATHNTPCSIVSNNLTFGNQLTARFLAGTTTVQLLQLSTGAAIASVAMDTAASVFVSGCYVV